MKVKFDKYFDESRIVLAITVILDPSKKFVYVQFVIKIFFGLQAAKTYLLPIRNTFNNVHREKEFGMLALSSSFNDHNGNSFTSYLNDDDYNMLNRSWCEKIRCRNKVDPKGELSLYLVEPLIDANVEFDILDWWHTNSLEILTL